MYGPGVWGRLRVRLVDMASRRVRESMVVMVVVLMRLASSN